MQIRQLVLGDLDTNCYIVWDDAQKALIIDPADDADTILNAVRQEGLTVVAVVLTHGHFDHMLAAESVCAATGAPLYVGRGDADAMTDPVRNLSGWFSDSEPVTMTEFRPLKEGDLLRIGEMVLSVLETPGHTPGCICLYSEGHLFVGDTLFRDSIGRLDFPGGDPNAMIESLRRLMQLPENTFVYSGHGPSTTIGREMRHNPYLR